MSENFTLSAKNKLPVRDYDFATWVKTRMNEGRLKWALFGWVGSQYSGARSEEKEMLEDITLILLTCSLPDVLINPALCKYHVAAEYLSSQMEEIYRKNKEGRFE